jgi:hypothetical protein
MTAIAVTEYFAPHTIGAVEEDANWQELVRSSGTVYHHGQNKRPVYVLSARKSFSANGRMSLADAGSFLISAFIGADGKEHNLSPFEKYWTPILAEGERVLDPRARIISEFRFDANLTGLMPGDSQVSDAYHIDDNEPHYPDAENRVLKRISDQFDLRGLWFNKFPGTFIVPPAEEEFALIERHGYIHTQQRWRNEGRDDLQFIKFHQKSLIAEATKNGWFKQFSGETITSFVCASAIHIGGTPPVNEIVLSVPFDRLLLNLVVRTDVKYDPPSRRMAAPASSLGDYSRR